MIKLQLFFCFLALLQSSLLPTPQVLASPPPQPISPDLSPPSSNPTSSQKQDLETMQQSMANQYSSQMNNGFYNLVNPSDEAIDELLNSSNIEALKQQHNKLMAQFTDNSPNIDNGSDNTINGLHNIIHSGSENTIDGADNTLRGNNNYINGSQNDVQGNQNDVRGDQNQIINSKNNLVYGSGNVIMDESSIQALNTQGKSETEDNAGASSPPNYSKSDSGEDVASTTSPSSTNLSNQFEVFNLLGILLIGLHVLCL